MLVGRRREMGPRSFHDVTLAEARDARDAARKLSKAGVDPLTHRHTVTAAPPTAPTGEGGPVPVERGKPAPTLLACWLAYVAAPRKHLAWPRPRTDG